MVKLGKSVARSETVRSGSSGSGERLKGQRRERRAAYAPGISTFGSGKGRRGDKRLRCGIRLNPKNVLAANNLAVLLVDHKGDPQSLQKAFALSRDFEKDTPHPLFLDTLGWVRFKMGQQEDALRLLKHAVSKSPETSVLNYHLGMAFFHSGKPAEARLHLSKALKDAEQFEGRQEAEQVLAQIRG